MFLSYKIKLFLILLIISINSNANNKEIDTLQNEIIVGIKNSPPYIIKNQNGEYNGVSIELWEIIAKKLKINFKYKIYKENEILKMLKDVEEGNIDISINASTVTGKRIQRFDFTQPIQVSNLAIAVPIKQNNIILELLKSFFSQKTILIILFVILIICIMGISIWLIEKNKNPKEFRKGLNGIGDGMWWAATILASIGPATKAPRTFWGRIVGVIWMFMAIITISILIGNVASSLTAGKIKSDITSLHSLKKKKNGTMSGTSCENFLIKNNIPIAKKDFVTLREGLNAVSNGEIQTFICDEPILKYLIYTEQISEEVYIIPLKLATEYYSFALPKNSKLTNKINELIVIELEKNTWKVILDKYNLN